MSAPVRPPFLFHRFEPGHIQAMHRAFDSVCAKLQLSTGGGDQAIAGETGIRAAMPVLFGFRSAGGRGGRRASSRTAG